MEVLGFGDPKPDKERFSAIDLPSRFGPYLVKRQIAAGGMGVVYVAEDTRLGRRVALKLLRQVFFATEIERQRFQSEAELASQLEHPNIVTVHEVGEHDRQPYFTMKFIDGGNLADRLNKGLVPTRDAVGMMVKIANAVHYVHQRGILHRDLKSANILLDAAGEPLLTDFGLAKLLDTESGMTLSQVIAGTPDYMSPEQSAGRKSEISTATDVWALGVIFFQMLTERLPFRGESHSEVLRQVAESEPPAPSTIMRRMDRDLETLCLRCLEKDPSRRLSSAGELVRELERWQRGEPIRARRITGFERVGKWARRHPYRAALLGVSVLATLGAGAGIAWQWQRAIASEQRAIASANIERRTAYSATLAQALGAREKHDLGLARKLLNGIGTEQRGFDWRLLEGLCRGDEANVYRLGGDAGDEPQCLTIIPGRGDLAIVSADGHLHLRDAKGNEVRPARSLPPVRDGSEGGSHRYYGLTFSPDGQRLAYAKGDVLHVLDAETLSLIHEEISVRPQFGWLDNHRLLYGFNGSERAPPWPEAGAWILDFQVDDDAGGPVSITPMRGMCAPLAVSADRRFFVLHRVVTSPESWARTLHVYRTEADPAITSESVYSLPSNEYPGDLALSQGGRYLALSAGAGLKRSARVLDLSSGQLVFDSEFRFPIYGLGLDSENRFLGLVGGDSAVRLYEFSRPMLDASSLSSYDDDVAPIRCEQISPGGAHDPPQAFATRSAQDGRARFFLGHERPVMDLVFDRKGSFTTAGSDGTVRVWSDASPRASIRIGYQNKFRIMRHPAASSDGRYVLSYKGRSQLCDVEMSRASRANVTVATPKRQSPLAVFADGRPITIDHETGMVVTWVAEDGELREQSRIVEGASFDHDARSRRGVLSGDERRMAGSLAGRLYSVDFDSNEIVWGREAGDQVTVHANHDLSADGRWIASSDFGPRVTIHPFANPDEIVVRLGGGARDYDTAVVFSRDGRHLFTGNVDGRVRVWDTATWQELPDRSWEAHRSAVTALAVSHEGSLIATSGGDALKLFPSEPEPGEPYRRERLSFALDEPANWIQFARDEEGKDRALLYNVPGRTLEIWEGDLENPPKLAEPPAESGSLPVALRYHAAILLPDGDVLILGGASWPGVPRSSCYLLDSSNGVVRETGAMLECRSGKPSSILLPSGKVLTAGGGGRDGLALASCEIYDPAEETWSTTGFLAVPRQGGICFLLNTGKVLLAGGSNKTGALSACELYDPTSGEWSPTGATSTPPNGAFHLLLADGRVLAAGGRNPRRQHLASEIYDPATGVWTSTGALQTNRFNFSAVALANGGALIVGGLAGTERLPQANCERYDPATGGWRAAATLPFPRYGRSYSNQIATLLPNGKVLVAGGISGDSTRIPRWPAASYLYDPESDTWSEAADLGTPRSLHRAILLETDELLMIGGNTAHGPTRSVEFYDPGN